MSLKLTIQKKFPNMTVHYMDQGEIWASSNHTLYRSKDEEFDFKKVFDLKVPLIVQMSGRFRLPARLFRLGIRSLRKLGSGTFLVIADRRIFRLSNGQVEAIYSFPRGFGPLREGWCEDDKGNVYLGEYFINSKCRHPVRLLKSTDDGQTWEVIRSWHHIQHIHFVQYDPFSQRIWLGTGDRDTESSISFSEDEGKSWTEIGSGDQMFRAVTLLFTKEHVYWGSDAPTRQNYIYRYARKSGEIEKMVAVDGPVNYSMSLKNGIKLFNTDVEGNSEGKSAEWDRKSHIWASKDGIHWEDLIRWEKDSWPYILGFGRVYFPHGQCGNTVYFTAEALKKVDGTLIQAKIENSENS
jgi:hypothetical protein